MTPVHVWRTPIDERDLLEHFAQSTEHERFYWERPDHGEAMLGLGAALRIESRGASRFEVASRGLAEVRQRLQVQGDAPSWAGPLLVGGFAFDDGAPPSERWAGFPFAQLVLPKRLAIRRNGEVWGCVAVVGSNPSQPAGFALDARQPTRHAARDESPPAFHAAADQPLHAYRELVVRALESIRAGDLEKVVIARSCTVVASRPFDALRILRNLRSLHPSCTLFAVARGPVTFLGATPERLVRLEDERVRADAVAGSAPRGRSLPEDRRISRDLIESKKNQEEHAVVVRCIRDALERRCREISAPEAPRLLQTDGIQHLHTPIEGRLRDRRDTTVLDLVADLHPTPAVGGAPREAALDWLRRYEALDRGWYAGPLGWLTPDGEGEFTVALRSLLLRESRATLFAGAGIVSGSDPESELVETRLKLRSALGALLEI